MRKKKTVCTVFLKNQIATVGTPHDITLQQFCQTVSRLTQSPKKKKFYTIIIKKGRESGHWSPARESMKLSVEK